MKFLKDREIGDLLVRFELSRYQTTNDWYGAIHLYLSSISRDIQFLSYFHDGFL